LSSTKRLDTTQRVQVGSQFRSGRLTYGLNLDAIYNGSNQSIYDVSQPVRAFMPHYYQYLSTALTPSVQWRLPFGEPGMEPAVRLGLTGLARQYPYRYTQDSAGHNLATKQMDQELDVVIGGSMPLTKRFRLTSSFSQRFASSNNHFERYIQYSYRLFTAAVGVAFTY
jgi:hypothetical protein